MSFFRRRSGPPELRFAADHRGSRNWDRIIADGEARLPAAAHREYIAMPLGVAYHQRGSRAFAAGDLAAALRDVERAAALDPWFLRYHTTRAVVLDALGRDEEAFEAVDAFLTLMDAEARKGHAIVRWQTSKGLWAEVEPLEAEVREAARRVLPALRDVDDAEVDLRILSFTHEMGLHAMRGGAQPNGDPARAHATRGTLALRAGRLDLAEADLRRAMALQSNAFHAHCLGAALYARGDAAGAAEVEARSVAMEPRNTRYRWALVMSLRRLGRAREARAQAEEILALEPAVPAHRERFARLFP
jgi:Flp pilus assembly protein TadD